MLNKQIIMAIDLTITHADIGVEDMAYCRLTENCRSTDHKQKRHLNRLMSTLLKRPLHYSILILVSILWSYNVSYASTRQPMVKTEVRVREADRAKLLNNQLVEKMDIEKSTIIRNVKKELSKEVKANKEELTVLNDGIYRCI